MRVYRLKTGGPRRGSTASWDDVRPASDLLPSDEAPTAKPPHVYTVSELTREIKGVLEQAFAVVWIEGEVSDPKLYPSGHLYFDLKDDHAVLKCVMWQSHAARLKFSLEQGLQAVCCGRVSVYEKRGSYQLYVETIEPKGLGALQLAFDQLCAKLEKEGLFDPARKRPLPAFPQSVGVVTSPSGAAIEDLLKILRGHVRVVLSPTRVQGDGAAAQIARRIEGLNHRDDLDVLIIGRGGGSLEDLWAFNEEVVARAVAASRLPVISAVGHEKDTAISDLVADVRAPTPTKAAELIVAQRQAVLRRFAQVLEVPAFAAPDDWLDDLTEQLTRVRDGLSEEAAAALTGLVERVRLAHAHVWQQSPQALVERHAQRLGHVQAQLTTGMTRALEQALARAAGLAGRLHALSPLAVLARGYSITFDPQGRIIRRAAHASPGMEIRTRVHDGELLSRVTRTTTEVTDGENR